MVVETLWEEITNCEVWTQTWFPFALHLIRAENGRAN